MRSKAARSSLTNWEPHDVKCWSLTKIRTLPNAPGSYSPEPIPGRRYWRSIGPLREKGIVDLAPNLAVVADWESERILTNIIDPNRDVAPEYMEYVAETKSGDVLTGRVVAENDSGITIRMADNSSRDIPRADIKTLTNSGRSLMPDGLEAAFTVQSLADLIAYLKHPQ
jgi:putative heme-binding domain-containing protein